MCKLRSLPWVWVLPGNTTSDATSALYPGKEWFGAIMQVLTSLYSFRRWSAGMAQPYGHGGGACIRPDLMRIRKLTVIHTNGIHYVKVVGCGCHHLQYCSYLQEPLCMGWYPATVVNPQTFVTLECLDTFQLLNVVTNINVWDYITVLEQLVSAVNSDATPVSTCSLSPTASNCCPSLITRVLTELHTSIASCCKWWGQEGDIMNQG